jgi:hypothetical protein
MTKPRWLALAAAMLALFFPVTSLAEEKSQGVEDTYRIGVNALKVGDTALAKKCFEAVLTHQPGHANARYQLLNLNRRGPEMAAKARAMKLRKVMIAKVEFTETPLAEALEALEALIDKETKGEYVANFIVQDPGGSLQGRAISLQLKGVPASSVLDYMLQMTGAVARYEEFAIVVKPAG